MGKNNPGVRDGSGPYEGSLQNEEFSIGRRKQAGEKCPHEEDFEIEPELRFW